MKNSITWQTLQELCNNQPSEIIDQLQLPPNPAGIEIVQLLTKIAYLMNSQTEN